MGRPRKYPRREDLIDPEVTGVDGQVVEGVDQDDIETFLYSMAGSASYCRVERVTKTGERSQCETIGFDEIKDDPAEYLRMNWGPGKYMLALLGPNKKIVSCKMISVEARPTQNGPSLAGVAGVVSSAADAQIALMREQMQSDRQMLMIMMQAQKGPDIGALLQGIGALTSKGDPALMFGAMMNAFQTVRSATPEVDPIAKAVELISLAKKLSPGSEPGADPAAPTDWLGVVKDVGVRLLDTVGAARASASPLGSAPPPVMIPAAAAPAPGAPAAENSAGGPRTMADFYDSLRAGITFLRSKARLGRSPEFWADFLFEENADDRFNAIIHAVQRGGTIEQLFSFIPEIAADPVEGQWFRSLYVAIAQSLSPTDLGQQGSGSGADLDSPGAGGDGGNTGNHGQGGDPGQPH